MTEILKFSDFALNISFVDITGKAMKVTRFKFRYYTPLSDSIEAWFDGTNYSPNCKPSANGVVVVFENPKFNVGQLLVHRNYAVDNPLFENGQQEISQIEPLDIAIVEGYSRQKNSAPTTKNITSSQEGMLLIETLRVEALKGEKGDTGAPAMDYSIKAEQIVLDEFWIDNQGQRKPVYTRTFNQSTTDGHVVAYGMSAILSAWGYINDPVNNRASASLSDYLDIYIWHNPTNATKNELCMMKKTAAHVDYCVAVKYVK